VTLSENDPISFLGDNSIDPSEVRKPQFLLVSLRNNPATSATDSEIKRQFGQRKAYRQQLQAQDAHHSIEVFEASQEGTPAPSNPPALSIPPDLNLDFIRAHEPSSAVRMYCAPPRKADHPSPSPPRRPRIQHCPACDPRESDLLKPLPTKRREGTSHWQVLDEPLLPLLQPTYFSKPHKNHPFYLTAKKGPKLGMKVVVDDLVELREGKRVAFDRAQTRLIHQENQKRKKMLHDRSQASRERTSRRQQDVMELSHKSGQLTAMSKMSSTQSVVRMVGIEEVHIDPEEEEALRFLSAYDDRKWEEAQIARKADPLSQMLVDTGAMPA
jgi:hypothetical protein